MRLPLGSYKEIAGHSNLLGRKKLFSQTHHMLFAKGTRVRFIRTGDTGIIQEMLSDGMVNVYLEKDQMTIPAFPEDLERADQPIQEGKPPKPNPLKKKEPDSIPFVEQSVGLDNAGIHLAFLPIESVDGLIGDYEVYLINDTTYPVVFSITRSIRESVKDRGHGRIEPKTAQLTGSMPFDQLSDNPLFEVECWQITTHGTGPHLEKTVRLRPKAFFKKVRLAPFLNQQVHWFELFTSLQPPAKKSHGEDLLTYTQKNAVPTKKIHRPHASRADLYDVRSLAEFKPEIDLHIEQLTDNIKGLSNADIIRIQMQHFRQFLEKAIRLGVDRVFVIHGVGKGRLRNTIASELMQHPHVQTFKNEYHPRYGWGATEVIL
jgi:hypothetical protein